jgi:hypothetical protein
MGVCYIGMVVEWQGATDGIGVTDVCLLVLDIGHPRPRQTTYDVAAM